MVAWIEWVGRWNALAWLAEPSSKSSQRGNLNRQKQTIYIWVDPLEMHQGVAFPSGTREISYQKS
jgi:hypothetical protein